MRPNKYSLKSRQNRERSWLSRHFGSVVFSTLVFSSFAYALTWPTVPGEVGSPIEGSFWNYFQRMLVDTGSTTDGTVKKAETLGKNGGTPAIVVDAGGNIGVGGTGANTTYAMSVSGQALFSDTVMGTPPTATGHLATKGYVDARVVSAGGGGGGYGQCYRIKNNTAAYPSCASGYTRAYAAYGNYSIGSPNTNNIYFENNVGGAWFQNFGHIYLYYTYDNGTNAWGLYDDQDVQLAWGSFSSEPAIGSTFSSKKSTYMSYTTTSPTTFSTWGSYMNAFGYAVCCK